MARSHVYSPRKTFGRDMLKIAILFFMSKIDTPFLFHGFVKYSPINGWLKLFLGSLEYNYVCCVSANHGSNTVDY